MKSETPVTGVSGSHNQHARFSPSASHQWVRCTASIPFSHANAHRIPEDTSSVYSRLGTAAHDWAADLLLGKVTPDKVPDEFLPFVKDYADHCMSTVPEGVSFQVEVPVQLFYQPDEKGTADFIVATDERIVVRDYKHGMGVLVESNCNEQLSIYGMSVVHMLRDVYDFGPDTIVDLGVFQPRHRESAGQPSWEITLADLEEFCKPIEYAYIQGSVGLKRVQEKIPCGQRDVAASEILEAAPMLKFAPSDDACKFCKSRGFCEIRLAAATEGMDLPGLDGASLIALLPDLSKADAKAPVEERVNTAITEVVFDEVVPKEEMDSTRAIMLSDSYLVCIYERSKAIKRFLDDVEEMLEARALAGNPVAGTKIVEGRMGNRTWSDEAAADTFLRGQKLKESERYDFKLKSPTAIEKMLDISKKPKRTQTRFAELVTRSAPKPVLALADDKRPAIAAAIDALPDLGAADDFEV